MLGTFAGWFSGDRHTPCTRLTRDHLSKPLIVVTGASSGIGAATARFLSAQRHALLRRSRRGRSGPRRTLSPDFTLSSDSITVTWTFSTAASRFRQVGRIGRQSPEVLQNGFTASRRRARRRHLAPWQSARRWTLRHPLGHGLSVTASTAAVEAGTLRADAPAATALSVTAQPTVAVGASCWRRCCRRQD
ncbi:hypothetical protein CG747_38235 [Streptomyces sp. CB02959]|nr:hypothetical protein CG747_38235 [Streptomyces sp. CB02959]